MAKRRTTYGLYPKNFPRAVRGLVDQDYLAKLSPSERAWLAKFNDEYVAGKFKKGEQALHRKKAQRREIWRKKHAAERDCLNQPGTCYVDTPLPSGPLDIEDAATMHLDDPLYKEERERLRTVIDSKTRDREKKLEQAKRRYARTAEVLSGERPDYERDDD